MAKKRLMTTLFVAVMLIAMLPMTIASASEVVLLEDTFNNTYAKDAIDTNWWGKPETDSLYTSGNRWAVAYGGVGQLRDAEDGSLAIIRGVDSNGLPLAVGKETSVNKMIIADTIADNSTVEITYDFRTPDTAPKNSSSDNWFRIFTLGKSDEIITWCPFSLKINSVGITPTWAITDFYPQGNKMVIGKPFDRDPDRIGFTWGNDYTVKITLKPNASGVESYRFVAEVWENGEKLGTGIINEWSQVKSDVIKKFYGTGLNIVTLDAVSVDQEPEDILCLKGIKIKAIQPDAPLNVTYFPEEGCIDASVDTEAYAEFESPVNPVSASQVTVDGGASVAEVAMENDNKRVKIVLDGVKAKTSYNIEIKDVKGVNASDAFDYKWSFMTDGGIEVGEPYFGSMTTLIDDKASEIDIADAVDLANSAYLNGEAWGTNNPNVYTTDDNYLWAKPDDKSINVFSKKFTPVSNGEKLELSTDIYIKRIDGSGTRAFQGSLCIEGSGVIRKLVVFHHNAYNQTIAVLNSGTAHDAYGAIAEDTGVTTTGVVTSPDLGGTVTINKNSLIEAKTWPNPNTGKNTEFDGDLTINLTATPTADGNNYELVMTIKGVRMDITSKCTITKAEAMALDTVSLRAASDGTYSDEGYYGFKNIMVKKSVGNPYPVVGTNVVCVPYTNMSEAAFDTDVLVIERNIDTNEITNVTVIKKTDITGESGILECEFDVENAGSKVDIYAVNDADGMILLSNRKTFAVGE